MKTLSLTSLVLGFVVLTSPIAVDRAIAEETDVPSVATLSNPSPSLDQVTSVSQLSDVRPTDWAFQALQSLVERYGCIVGYPDRTYRGNRALSRYEFAAGLNACLDKIQELIAAATADFVRKEDLEIVQRLQEEFAAELATLRGRVESLDVRTATLEKQQFSTTTKLAGEVIIGAISILGGDRANGESADRIPTLGNRVRLNLETSFTGRDLLTTRLQAGNFVPLGGTTPTGQGLGPLLTNEGRIEFDGDSGNRVGIGLLRYRFPLGPRTNVYIAGAGNGFVDLDASSQLTPYFDGSAVSLFGLRNPIYNYSFGSGLGLRHQFNDVFELNLGYLVPDFVASNPSQKNGLFDGQYGALAQLIVNFSPSARIGFTYINAYSPFPNRLQPEDAFNLGATGSNLANSNFGTAVNINAYGITGTVDLTRNVALSGWVGYANHRYIGKGDGQVWNWLVGVAFPDLFKKGSIGGLLVGMEPKLTGIDRSVNGGQTDRDTSLHFEAYYKHRINDNISITPGVIWLTAPNHDARNDDVFIGVVRTAFSF
ncbi:MAG: iron uptake porin [Leptolyngbyaceae cyanobacterium bins.349]|nr:iron uptake porin [Leptolyngbyaceae cyanobacterium bins.349]